MVDERVLRIMRERVREIENISKKDGEEEKELDLKKQNDLFNREAKELHEQVEELLDEADEHKIEEALDAMEIRKEEMNQRFKKLGERGVEAVEDVMKEFKKWNECKQEIGI